MSLAPISERVPDFGPSGLPAEAAGVVWRRPSVADAPAIRAARNLAGAVDHPEYRVPLQEVVDEFDASWMDPALDLVVGERDGEIVAWGSVSFMDGQDTARKVQLGGGVVPEARRQGIGSALLDWEERRASERLRAVHDRLPAEVQGWASADASFVPFATGRGYRVARWFTDLHRDLAEPIVPLDDSGLEIVPLSNDLLEATRIARNDVFRDHWGSQPTTPERWRHFTGLGILRHDLSSLAVVGDRVVGFVLTEHNPEDAAAAGYTSAYIALVGVVRDYRGRGVAPRLLTRTLQMSRDAGLERAVLDVDSESPTGAVGLYERVGFRADKQSVVLERTW